MVNFGNPTGIYALLTLIPLIILYLIRPKPTELTIPSLMFLIQDRGLSKKSNFLKHILKDILLLLHILALIALALSIAEPIMNVPYDSAAKSTVIVLDMSASMQAQNRFADAVDAAKKWAKGDTSIILAENTPLVVQERVSANRAKSFLGSLEAKSTTTNLGDAIVLAKDFANSGEGRVIVISDFLVTDGPDPAVSKKVLESTGLTVDFVEVEKGGKNVGIVDLAVDKSQSSIVIKNFEDKGTTINLEIINNRNAVEGKKVTLLPNSIETLSFATMGGATIVRIAEKDDLMVDNTAYLSAPNATDVEVALISNSKSAFLENALLAAGNVRVKRYEPPLTGKDIEELPQRIIVLSGFDKQLLHSSLFKNEFTEKVQKGATLIIAGQNDIHQIDFGSLLPVTIEGKGGPTTVVPAVINQITRDVEFGSISEHFIASAPNESVVLAAGSSNEPIIALKEAGAGRVLFYGIDDEKSDFKYSPSYPIFWSNVIDVVTGAKDIGNFNQKTGRILVLPEATWIKTPSGNIKTNRLLMDEAGFYEVEGVFYAANLLNERESNINAESTTSATAASQYKETKVTKRKDVNFGGWLAFIALLVLAGELFYIKWRGDF